MVTTEELAGMVDHTNLNVDATEEDIRKLCNEALLYGFAAVCVRSNYIKLAKEMLGDSKVRVCSVVGFPTKKNLSVEELSKPTTEEKVKETKKAIKDGADEIDMVINITALKRGDFRIVEKDIKAVIDAAAGRHVKVILEMCHLTKDEKIKACKLCEKAGAAFVKTSTGFSFGGANLEDVKLMSENVSEDIGIKTAGGIHSIEAAMQFYEAVQKPKPHKFRVGASKLAELYKRMGKNG